MDENNPNQAWHDAQSRVKFDANDMKNMGRNRGSSTTGAITEAPGKWDNAYTIVFIVIVLAIRVFARKLFIPKQHILPAKE